MKKVRIIIVAVLLLMSLAGCSDKSTAPKTTTATGISPTQAEIVSASPIATSTIAPTPATSPVEPSTTPTVEAITNKTGLPLNAFTLDVTLNAKKHKLVVKQSIVYNNNTGKELKDIYFNLIPEAFKKQGGDITMKSIAVGDKSCKLKNVKETVYKINLPSKLAAGKNTTIQMEYEVRIPNLKNRFGYQKNVFNLGNFIVTPAVYNQDGWSVEPYVDLGDAFYTDVANYTVTIHAPKGYKVAATGKDDGNGTYHIENVRDFAFCASDSYETLQETYDGTVITIYYGDHIWKTAKRIMNCAKKSLKLYNESYGKYPYETLNLVVNGLSSGVAGMEYPTLVMLAPNITVEDLDKSENLKMNPEEMEGYLQEIDTPTCHEIAHQWFYGIVGNDQISYPWLDEGFCCYSEYLYQEAYPPEKDGSTYSASKGSLVAVHYYVLRSSEDDSTYGKDTTYMNESLYYWMKEDPMGYAGIYAKGGSLLYQMEVKMGKEEFLKAVREYVQKFAYQFVTPDSFKQYWNSKGDFTELFELYLKNK